MLAAGDATTKRAEFECGQSKRVEPPYTYKTNSRYRWNVLDLLSIFGGRACVSHITCEIDMSNIEIKRSLHKGSGRTSTVTAFILKAIASAQVAHPQSRTFALPFGKTVTYNDIVAGFTAEKQVNGEPIVFFGEIEQPHTKVVTDLADELKEYVAKDVMDVPKLKTQAVFCRFPWLLRQLVFQTARYFPFFRLLCMRATFGVSSLGSLGVAMCYGPSVCSSVFGVGAVEKRVEVRQGQLAVRDMMTLSLSFDQNVMDGASAARFLNDVKRTLESGFE